MADELWRPREYCDRYGFRCEPPYDGPPHYPRVPTLEVVDLAAKSLRPKRRDFWRDAREYALGQWSDVGFDITVFEDVGQRAYEPGTITIDVCDTQDGTKGQTDFGATVPNENGYQEPWRGVAWVHFDTEWFGTYFRNWQKVPVRKIIGHEFGHALAFGHHDVPKSVMNTYATGGLVTLEDEAAAKDYWHV